MDVVETIHQISGIIPPYFNAVPDHHPSADTGRYGNEVEIHNDVLKFEAY